MGYYVRHFVESETLPTLEALVARCQLASPDYAYEDALMFGGDLVAAIEINPRGSEMFDEEIEEFQEELTEKRTSKGKTRVTECLNRSSGVIALQVLGDVEVSWERLSPIFDYLAEVAPGLTQLDEVGFYEGSKLILRLE